MRNQFSRRYLALIVSLVLTLVNFPPACCPTVPPDETQNGETRHVQFSLTFIESEPRILVSEPPTPCANNHVVRLTTW